MKRLLPFITMMLMILSLLCGVAYAARQALIPGFGESNELLTRQALIPGGMYLNDTQAAGGGGSVWHGATMQGATLD